MKREILCRECCENFIKLIGADRAGRDHFTSSTKYVGENIIVVDGDARNDYRCDHCGGEIKAGGDCSAFSIFTVNIPYFEWENDYIKARGGKHGL